jgi:YbbR domain-containing protein
MRSLKDLLFENWHLKLFSLLVAIGLWALIAQESTSEIFFQVPVEYQNVPPNTEVIADSAKTVEVRLRGPSRLIREIAAKDVSTIIDLGQLPQDGEKILPLKVHTPFGVEVVLTTPSRIRVSLEPTATAELPVAWQGSGHLPPGYEVDTVAVKPSIVKVEGPASRVHNLTNVATTPVDLSNRKTSFNQMVGLDPQDALVRIPDTSSIRVDIKIRKKP